MSLMDRQTAVVKEFADIAGWEDRYKRVISIGKALPSLDEQYRIEDLLVKGCQSEAWIHAALNDKGEIVFQGDSEAMIARGIVALLIRVYSLATPQEILESEPDFIREIGFESNLTPSRANGLFAMIKQMKYYAMAFSALK